MARSMRPSTLFLTSALVAVCAFTLVASDPDPIRDYPAGLTADDFYVDDIRTTNATNTGLGGIIHQANSNTLKGLSTQGVSYALLQLKPDGQHLPHWHLRASELVFVIEGTIRVTWIDSAGKLFDQTLKPYGSTVIPRGLVHTIKNVGKKNSTNLSSFGSELAGAQVASTTLFSFPVDLQVAAFQQSQHIVQSIDKIGLATGTTPTIYPPSRG